MGQLVDPSGPWTRGRDFRDRRSKLWPLGPGRQRPRTAGRPREASGTGPSCRGLLADTTVPPNRAQVAWEIWSKPQALGHGSKSPGTAGQPRGPSDPGPSARDSQSTPRALGPKCECPGIPGQPRGLRSRAGVSRDSWSPCAPSDLNPRRAGRHRRSSEPSVSVPEHLVNTAGPWSQDRGAQDIWLTPQGIGHGPEVPGRPGRNLGPLHSD